MVESGFPFALRHRTAVTVLANLGMATVAYVFAFALRFDLSLPPHYRQLLLADSKGQFVNDRIRDAYPFRRIH